MKDALDKRQRRSRVPVSEKLKAIDDQMAELKMCRDMVVEAHRAKIKAMEAEVE